MSMKNPLYLSLFPKGDKLDYIYIIWSQLELGWKNSEKEILYKSVKNSILPKKKSLPTHTTSHHITYTPPLPPQNNHTPSKSTISSPATHKPNPSHLHLSARAHTSHSPSPLTPPSKSLVSVNSPLNKHSYPTWSIASWDSLSRPEQRILLI